MRYTEHVLLKHRELCCIIQIHNCLVLSLIYCIVGKFGKFGKLSVICQTKTVQSSSYNY